jgi:RHS repeat-associated protein
VYSYDALGRLIGVEHHDGAKETYTYRADGALLQADNDDTSVRFERDLLGRVIKETQGELEIENAYDRQGMRVRMRSSLGADVSVTRNSNGDVLSVRAGEFAAQFERDALGRELARSLPGGLRSRWRRDRSGRPVEHIVTAGSGQTLCAVGYGWAPNDRLQRRVDAFKGRDEYHHDARGYLAASRYADDGVDLRVPDAVGNVFKSETRTDREYGPAGQLLRARSPSGDTHYAYDAEGNLIEKRDAAGRAWQYAWNSAGHLASVTRPDGDRVSFTYDPFGRRVSKRYRGQTTKWLWDGDAPLHEWVEQPKSAPTPLTWLFEPESTAPLARLEASTCQALITDHLATPTLVVNSDHSVAWSAGLDAYGNLRDASGDSALCPFRWPGQYADLETGLYYNRHRYYDPESGQYASQDPIRLHGGRALYAYVPDPLTWTDPLGLSCALHERQSAAAEALAPLKQAFPEAAVGFRGSLARGRKGPHKGFAPFDPNNFDVDAFIVSDELAARVPPNRQGFRDLQKAGRQERKLVDDLGRRLSAIPGIRQEKMTVRIFSDDEFARKVRLDERYLL